MSDVVIKIENLWKEYRLGIIGHGTLMHDLQSWWSKIQGKEDPNAKLETGLSGNKNSEGKDRFWALKDINLEVKKGEVLGIIGRNGAGKSTLLKILSRVTAPTRGTVKAKGRIASLLEVGTGFHKELTGRENIYLNGSILGMSRDEVLSRFDEIVDFSGIEQFIDTPVKRYSSGMYVRLAFSVAAHLDPEILLVDEVLAVGDSGFQKKCLNKMNEISKEGRTILFVSHNLAAIENLCTKCFLIEDGKLALEGATKNVIAHYLNLVEKDLVGKENLAIREDRSGNGKIRLIDFYIEDINGNVLNAVSSGLDVIFVFKYKTNSGKIAKNVDIGFSIHSGFNLSLFVLYSSYVGEIFSEVSSEGEFRCFVQQIPLSSGRYRVGARITVNGEEADWPQNGIGYLDVEYGDFYGTGSKGFEGLAPFLINGKWQVSPK